MEITNPPRLTDAQFHALGALARGNLVLSNEGQYILQEKGAYYPDITASKKALKVLGSHGFAEFKTEGETGLYWKITSAGAKALDNEMELRTAPSKPGPRREQKPLPQRPRGVSLQQGMIAIFVNHKLAKGEAFATVREATDVARRIQAGYALADKKIPDITLEHRKYTGVNQKTLIRVLNNDPTAVHEVWHSLVKAYTNSSTYAPYEAITK